MPMDGRWKLFCFSVLIIIVLQIQGSWSLNSEGLVLLQFRARVDSDPHESFRNWNADDINPCSWFGVGCEDGKVRVLDLSDLSLEGTLAPELGQLSDLRSLILYKNQFYGEIPKEFGALSKLELLDLRSNNLDGQIPVEIGSLQVLKHLLIRDNKFQGSIPVELERLNLLSVLQFGNRKFGQGDEQNIAVSRRRLLEEFSNLAAAPAMVRNDRYPYIIALPLPHSSGAFPAVPNARKKHPGPPAPSPSPSPLPLPSPASSEVQNQPEGEKQQATHGPTSFEKTWKYVVLIPVGVALFVIAAVMFFVCRSRAVKTIGPWKTGLSGQLQKAFVTGVPKLNRSELETACEDFSNIIQAYDGYTVYKGTLSSGVEIAVASTAITSANEWSKGLEKAYRRKIDTLSRINHKNFVNLIGFCEEEEPFVRMMVFEYAPNGTLMEHLHVEEMEHLDWNSRMRIVMGTAYCMQYMHELTPAIAHSNLCSSAIYLTDDYAAKVGEVCFIAESALKPRSHDESEHSRLPPLPEPETNVYNFGTLLIEIISGKPAFSEEHGPVERWAAEYLKDKSSISSIVDPSLKSCKTEELEVIAEVIKECIKPEPRHRPLMKDIVTKLREVINISPEQATPRLSPLWWAELEILSAEAT